MGEVINKEIGINIHTLLYIGEGNGNPLQYSYLGNSLDRGAWQVTVHGVTKELDTT